MASITPEWQEKWKGLYEGLMLFGNYACDQCDRIVPMGAGFVPDSSLPNPDRDFVLCSTGCLDEWNAAHGSLKLKINVTVRNKNYTITKRIVKNAYSGGRFEYGYVDEEIPYDTGTFGLDRSPPPLTPEEKTRYEAVIDDVIAHLDDPEEKEPPKTHVQRQSQASAKLPEEPAVPQEPIVSPPSPAEIAGALKAYKALLEEEIILEAEYNYVRGKIMGVPREAAAAVSAAEKAVEDIRTFKTMADDGLISAEDFKQRRHQVLGYDVALKKYAQDLERVKLDGMKLIDVINKDEEICRIAVKQSGWALKYVPEQYRTLEMCLLATAQKPYAITFVPGELVDAVAKENPSVFTDLAPKNIGACLAVIAENGLTLEHLPEKFHTPEIYLAAVTQNGLALQFVPEKQRTKNILLAAVQNTGMAVQFLPKTMNMSGQFAVVLWQKVITDACVSAVTQNGMALQVIPDKYRHHDDILLAAVTQNGLALQFVQESDKTKELCRAAVAQNKAALQFVPDKLKKKM